MREQVAAAKEELRRLKKKMGGTTDAESSSRASSAAGGRLLGGRFSRPSTAAGVGGVQYDFDDPRIPEGGSIGRGTCSRPRAERHTQS